MSERKVLPTNEMRGDVPLSPGSCAEEIPPNDLNDKRISQLAHQSVFAFQPDVPKWPEGGSLKKIGTAG